MAIVSSRTVVFQCKLCGLEKPHASLGICIASVCVDCTKTLPPIPAGMRRCPVCLELHTYKHAYCKQCKSEYVKARYDYDAARDAHLRYAYNLTAQEYDLMFFRQAGLCAICQQPEPIIDPYTKQPKNLVPDHNHVTGDIRELLCHRCNIVLGELEKDRHVVKRMLKYLKRHDT